MTSVHTSPRSRSPRGDVGETDAPSDPVPEAAPRSWGAALHAGAFPLLAGLAGIGAALGGLLLCLGVAVVGWFLADAGGHGDTRDAMRAGADAWLVGHGSGLDFGGVRYTVVPLGLTLLLALFVHRTIRAAARTLPPADQRETGLGIGLVVIGYVSTAVVVAVVAGTDAARVPLLRAVVGAALMAGLVGGAAVLSQTDRWALVTHRLPGGSDGPAPVVARAVARVAVWTVLAGLVLVVASLVVHASTVSAMLSTAVPPDAAGGSGSSMDRAGDLGAIGLLTALLLPNAALLGAGYLVGPGFAVGTGTTVSATAVTLGPVPAFPLLGALPAPGREPWFLMLVWLVPVVVAAAAVVRTVRRSPGVVGPTGESVLNWRLGGLAGALGGVLLGVLTGLGGGVLGSGRMAEVGTTVWEVALFAAFACGAGGVLGGLLARMVNHLLDRARVRREARRAARGAAEDELVPEVAARVRQHAEAATRVVTHDHTRHHPADGRPPAPGVRPAEPAPAPDEDSLSATDLLAAFTDQTSPVSSASAGGRRAPVGGWEQDWSDWAGVESEWTDDPDEPTAPLVR